MWAVLGTLCIAASAKQPPHLFFALIDDLGYANVGFNRANATIEVQTPVIDGLAHSGVILGRHYVHYVCTPTRSSIQSGRLPVHVQIALADPSVPTSGIPRNMTGLAAKLKAAPVPYMTHYVGKW
jgi:arylsulfatase I/J